MASLITDKEVKSLSEDQVITEKFKRGAGALMIRKRGNSFLAFYRYWKGKQKAMVPIGSYKSTNKVAGFTLAQLREKALELSIIRQQIAPQDLKEHLEHKELQRQTVIKQDRKKAEIEASRGTLQELCEGYIASLERRKADSKRKAETLLNTHCLKAFPELASRKARVIAPEDIVSILSKMISEGKTTVSNRVRSYLHAAFSYGMKADHDPRQQVEHGKQFHLSFNPVAAVPRQADYERVRERRLDDSEIRRMWLDIDKGKVARTPLYGLLLRLCLACYGNRPQQILRCTWKDVDFVNRTLSFIDYKGKNGTGKKRIIPLSKLAVDLLVDVKKISGSYESPFSVNGTKPMRTEQLGRLVTEYNNWLHDQAKANGYELPERWTAKDLRTTATSLLTRLRIPKEQRYLLQSREDGSIESKHYDHDDRLPEKREAARIYTAELERIIEGREAEKLVDLAEYREQYGKQ